MTGAAADSNNQRIEMGYLVDFEKAIENHDAPSILRLWEEYTSTDEVEEEDFFAILEVVKASELSDYIGRHIERGIHLWNLMKAGPLKDDVLRLIVDLEVTDNPNLRSIALQHLKERYGREKMFREKMCLIGLRGGAESFKGAISHYELLNHMEKGNFVFHTAGWGVGEIMDVSMIREQVSCEFDSVPGRKDLSFEIAFHTLIPIAETHFLARRFGSPDDLEARAKKNPVEVIRMLLKDLGSKTASEIKDELCELVIPEDEWNKWWQTARSKIKKDTRIENAKNIKSPFRLLKEEISHEERLQRALEDKPDVHTLINMMYAFLKDFSNTLKNPEFKTFLLKKLKELISGQEITPVQELQLHFFLQDLSDQKHYPPIDTLIKNSGSIKDLIKEIPIQGFKKRMLINIRCIRKDWEALFLELLLAVEQNPLRDYILGELIDSPAEEALKERLADLALAPQHHP
jgi:transcription elongation factor GreA-like protein